MRPFSLTLVCLALLPLSSISTLVGCSNSDGGGGSSNPGDDTAAPGDDTTPPADSGPGSDTTPGSDTAPPDDSGDDGSAETTPGTFTDLGFRPKPNGFPFENYGKDPPYQNLGPAELQRMFGDVACSSTAGGTCTLTPAAETWMNQQNDGMGGGHCEGMAALSLLMFLGKVKVSDFGSAPNAFGLDIASNTKLQHEIAYWFVTQAVEPTASAEIRTLTPKEILAKLQEGLSPTAPETFTMGIYQRGPKGGHAITPYKVDVTATPAKISVYDNNFPGDERTLEVDVTADTWKYFASTSPTVPGSLYEGDATTKTLTLTSTSARLKPQQCPFCGAAASDGSVKGSTFSFREIFLDGPANLLITEDASGKRIGWDAAGALINEISGARYVTQKSDDLWKDDFEPIYLLPFGSDLTVSLDGSTLTAAAMSDVSISMPAFGIDITGINLDPGQKDTIQLSKDGTQIIYKTAGSETPTLDFGVTIDADADWDFAIKAHGESAGQNVTMKLDLAKKQLVIKLVGADASASYDLEATRVDATSSQVFKHTGNGAKPTDTLYLDYGSWAGDGKTMKLLIDTNGDGTPDSSVDLTDTP